MNIKTVNRNIPADRENQNDRFRVIYGDKNDFDLLRVNITRSNTGEELIFEFDADDLTEKDSIHFSTAIVNNKMQILWDEIISAKARLI